MQLVAVLPDGSLSVLGRSWYSRLGCELAFIHAQAHAREQANTTALSSLGGDASTPLQRARAVVPAASAAGEVAAAGYDSVLGAVVALLWCGSRTVFICLKRLRHCCLDIRASKCTPQLHAKSRLRAVPSSAAAHRRRPVYVPQIGAKHVWASVHAVPWAVGFETGVEWRVDALSWASAQQARTRACSVATALTARLCGRSSPQHRRVILVRHCQTVSL
jgi:hypothetical protein